MKKAIVGILISITTVLSGVSVVHATTVAPEDLPSGVTVESAGETQNNEQIATEQAVPASTAPLGTPAPSASATEQIIWADSILAGISIVGVEQSSYTPNAGNRLSVSVLFKNSRNANAGDLSVTVTGGSSTSLSPIDQFVYSLSVPARSTKALEISLYVPSAIMQGNFPVDLELCYIDGSGNVRKDTRRIFVYIDRGKGVSGTLAVKSSKPQVIIENYSIGGALTYAGSNMDFAFTLKNASKDYGTKNIKIKVLSDGVFTPKLGETGTWYVESLNAGETTEVKMVMKAGIKAAGDYPLEIIVEYEDELNQLYTESTKLWIPLANFGTLSIDSVVIPETATVGQRLPLNIRFNNSSDTDMQDVVLVIDGNIEGEKAEIDTGALKTGKANFIDHTIVFTEAGTQTLTLNFNCVDRNNNKYTIPLPDVKVEVAERYVIPETETGQENQNAEEIGRKQAFSIFNWSWLMFIGGGALLAAGAGVYFIRFRNRNK